MRFLFTLVIIGIVHSAFAQITDDFSDGDFTSSPTWNGDQSKFEVNTLKQLQLNALPVADTAYLSTPNVLMDGIEWDFFFKMDFSLSASNYVKVFLASDQSNVKQTMNGYYLKMGMDGSNDSIELHLKKGALDNIIMPGVRGRFASSTVSVSVKVTRDSLGNWAVYSDTTGGTNYFLEGTVTDTTFTATSYFGFYCKYSSTRNTSFYFDNIYVGAPIVDVTPPEVISVTPTSSTQLDVKFSEPVDQTTSENELNYSVDNSIGNPSSAVRDGSDLTLVHLTFASAFGNGVQNHLTISNIADLAGNAFTSVSLPFIYYTAQGNDVVINEIMADPDPAVGLPSAEYVELFNRSQFPADLTGWKFSDASTTQTLSSYVLLPDSFLILCDDATASQLASYGSVMALTSFPSLNNDGDDLSLSDASSNLINEVNYDISWYHDDVKAAGGYSLELIDPASLCTGVSNWHGSIDASGGTPGRKNSVVGNFNDTIPPQLTRASVLSNSIIELVFDGTLDIATASAISHYSVQPGITVLSALALSPDFSTVDLQISPSIDTNTIYTVTVRDLADCSGNTMTSIDSAQVSIPSQINVSDILINEILFNPVSGGYDYVEIYNNTNKTFDLKDLKIANADDADSLSTVSDITTDGYLFFPQQFIVITENPDWVKQNYFAENPNWFIQVSNLPSYNDDEGRVVLLNNQNERVDELHYLSAWQFPLLNSDEGVALERIDPNQPTQDSMNWHSAASTVGFGTPTYKNSQYSTPDVGNDITLSPQVFSPDNDGFNDLLNISYQFDQAGYTANIKIYDSQGRQSVNLVKNALLAQSGSFTWDGIDDNGEKAKVGTYIVYVEVFDLSGTVKHYKEVCVVAARKS